MMVALFRHRAHYWALQTILFWRIWVGMSNLECDVLSASLSICAVGSHSRQLESQSHLNNLAPDNQKCFREAVAL